MKNHLQSKKVDLDDLLLVSNVDNNFVYGNETLDSLIKNDANIIREYGIDKWGTLFTKLNNSKFSVIKDVDKLFFENMKSVMLYKNKFYEVSALKAQQIYKKIVYNKIKKYLHDVDTIVEIGAGYGSILFYLAEKTKNKKNYIAVELTKSGCQCIDLISHRFRCNLSAVELNILNLSDLKNQLQKKSLIYSSYSLISVKLFSISTIKKLIDLDPAIVIHFEPLIKETKKKKIRSLLKVMYIKYNDYNSNILNVVNEACEQGIIELVELDFDIFGQNALLPASFIAWKPV